MAGRGSGEVRAALQRRTNTLIDAVKPSEAAVERRLGLFQEVARLLSATFDCDARVRPTAHRLS
jgi:hypothetical protein